MCTYLGFLCSCNHFSKLPPFRFLISPQKNNNNAGKWWVLYHFSISIQSFPSHFYLMNYDLFLILTFVWNFRFARGVHCRRRGCRQESRSGLSFFFFLSCSFLYSFRFPISSHLVFVLNQIPNHLGFFLILISIPFLVVNSWEILPNQTCHTQRRGTLILIWLNLNVLFSVSWFY